MHRKGPDLTVEEDSSGVDIDHNFIDYADGDREFAAWCSEVERLSMHFIDVSLCEFDTYGDPREVYIHGHSPMFYIKEIMVPAVVCEQGCDFIEEIIADNVFWGSGE